MNADVTQTTKVSAHVKTCVGENRYLTVLTYFCNSAKYMHKYQAQVWVLYFYWRVVESFNNHTLKT